MHAGPAIAAICLLLGVAAWRDLTTRTVPDLVSLLIAGFGATLRVAEGWEAAGLSALVALLLFVLLLVPAVQGVLGGGDVKLAAAVAMGLPPLLGWHFVFATALVGGLLGVLYLLGPRLLPHRPAPAAGPAFRRVIAIEAWRLRRRGPLPYAVAIAAGGWLVLLSASGS